MQYKWEHLTDKQLMNIKLKDLGLNFANPYSFKLNRSIDMIRSEIGQKITRLYIEHYISIEWFTTYKSCTIAIPFYLFHPRLINLEIEKTGWAEYNSDEYTLKLLRHEVGHIIDDLCYNKCLEKHKIFGTVKKYPNQYTYNPYSKRFVKNLNEYYAQCCPEEDFAETFAVWLDYNSNWLEKYKNTPAINKLLFINNTICKKTENIKYGKYKFIKMIDEKYKFIKIIDSIDMTLGEYYKRKKKRYNRKVPKNTIII